MFTIAKSFAYKFCFCLGLGTATYYSYGEVQKWVRTTPVKTVENVIEKHMSRENTVYDDSYVPQEISYTQPTIAPVQPVASAEVPTAPVAAVTEEKKDEDKKDETAEKKDENVENSGMIVSNQNLPATYAPQLGHAPASTHAIEEEKPSSPNMPMAPNALASPSPASGSSVGLAQSTLNGLEVGALDASDIAALISPLKASFSDQMNVANGLLCESSVEGRGHNCDRRNHVSVHSLRWGMSEGLKKDVSFSIKSSSGTSLEFALDFKIQNTTLSEENFALTARPTEVLVHSESKDSKVYRVIEFKFADLSVRGELLRQVQATMTFEVTPNGLVLGAESQLSFTRSKAQVSVAKWDPTVTDTSSQGGFFLIADELAFSMNIEKSL